MSIGASMRSEQPETGISRRFLRTAALAATVLLVSVLNPHLASAQAAPTCPDDPTADVQGCINQDGDNNASIHEGGNLNGGDGVAGSQVIGAAGSGPTTIHANNTSTDANAEGGEANADFHTTVTNGPKLTVTGSGQNVTARATGNASTTQTFDPTVSITLNQFSSPTGSSFTSNTATPTITETASQLVDGTATLQATGSSPLTNTGSLTGTGPVSQSLTQTASSAITQTGAPVNVSSSNTADPLVNITNTQTGTAVTNPVATATAGESTTHADITQDGDNDLHIFDTANLTGGDGVAGSEVIGAAGSGATNITAANTSTDANSEGGDATGDYAFVGGGGPSVTATGPAITVTAIASGTATVEQAFTPSIAFLINQTSTPLALSTTTNLADPTLTLGASQSVTGVVTGAAPLTQSATGTSPVTQTIDQSAFSSIDQSGGPVTVTSTNVASPSATLTNLQSGSAFTSPQATATSGDHHLVADLNQNGDNNVHVFHAVNAVAGDGVAGSQVIGVASSGPSTIDATNNSTFANSEGGDATVRFADDIDPGPKLDVTAPPITVTAVATGVATVVQTATPNFTVTVNQVSDPTGSSVTTNTASPTITLTSTQNVTGSSTITSSGTGSSLLTTTGTVTGTSPVTQSSVQSGTSTVNQTGSPVNVISSNVGPTGTFTFTNSQNTTVITNPVANATADGVTTSDAFTGDGVSSSFSIS
jgi:hypothetical protein